MGGLEHDPTTYDRDHLGRGIKYFHANIGTSNGVRLHAELARPQSCARGNKLSSDHTTSSAIATGRL